MFEKISLSKTHVKPYHYIDWEMFNNGLSHAAFLRIHNGGKKDKMEFHVLKLKLLKSIENEAVFDFFHCMKRMHNQTGTVKLVYYDTIHCILIHL